MSGFIRPEIRAWLARWAEPMVAGTLAVVGLGILWRGFNRFDWMLQLIGAVLLLIGLASTWAGYRRSQFAQNDTGPGLVEVAERQIRYLTPNGGGAVDIEAMTRLEIRTMIDLGRVWVLKQSEGPVLFIPLSATGSETLFDAFSALPGMDVKLLIAAVNDGSDHRSVIWRGAPGFRALT